MSTQTGAESEAGLLKKAPAHSLSMSVLPFKSQLRVASYTFGELRQSAWRRLKAVTQNTRTLTLTLIEVVKAFLLVGCFAQRLEEAKVREAEGSCEPFEEEKQDRGHRGGF